MNKSLIVAVCLFISISFSYAAEKVDINTATQQELESVKGIGPSKALAIIEHRSKYGNFISLDELDRVPGFGKKGIDKLRALVTVSGSALGLTNRRGKAPYDFMKGGVGLEALSDRDTDGAQDCPPDGCLDPEGDY